MRNTEAGRAEATMRNDLLWFPKQRLVSITVEAVEKLVVPDDLVALSLL